MALGEAFTKRTAEKVMQTDDATPVVALSFPVPENKVVGVDGYVTLFNLAGTQLGVAKVDAVFGRATGNVGRPSAPEGNILANNFTAPFPSLNLVANTSTQSIDVVVTGKAAMSIRWHLDVLFRMTA